MVKNTARFVHMPPTTSVVTDLSVSDALVAGKASLDSKIDRCCRAGSSVRTRRPSRSNSWTTSRWHKREQWVWRSGEPRRESGNSSRRWSIAGAEVKLSENKHRRFSSSSGQANVVPRLKLSRHTDGDMSARAPGVRARQEMRQNASDRRFGRIGVPSARDRSSSQMPHHAGPSNANRVMARTREAYSTKRGQPGCFRGSATSPRKSW